MEVLSLRNLKVIYFRAGRACIVIPPQCLRCIGWQLLLLALCLIVRAQLSNDYIDERIGSYVWQIGIMTAMVSGLLAVMTVFTDPGILPPINISALSPEEQQQLLAAGGMPSFTASNGGYEMQSPNSILEQLHPQVAQFEIGMQAFCRKCQHLRPPMAAHCWWSDVCIMEMDHYCSILGVVIGARNLRWFMLYLLSVIISGMFGMYITFNALEVVFASTGKLVLFIVIICVSLIATLSTGYFFAKGLRLILAGQSTRGEIKGLQTSAAAVKGWPALSHVLFPSIAGSLLPEYFDEMADIAAQQQSSAAAFGGDVSDDERHVGDRIEIGNSGGAAIGNPPVVVVTRGEYDAGHNSSMGTSIGTTTNGGGGMTTGRSSVAGQSISQ